MNTNHNILIFSFTAIIIWQCITAEQTETKIDAIENLYLKNYSKKNAPPRPNAICKLEENKEKLFGLCKEILNRNSFKIKNIHFNHAAAFNLIPKCVINDVSFNKDLDRNLKIKENMVPCYGRNEPIRTSWIVDDNVDNIWISDGFEKDSFFIYSCYKFLSGRQCQFYEFTKQKNIDKVSEYSIEKSDVEREMATPKQVTYIQDQELINRLYIREEAYSSNVCSLIKDLKRELCKKILSRKWYTDWTFQEEEPQNPNYMLECRSIPIDFKDLKKSSFDRAMYPCYGIKNNPDPGVRDSTEIFSLSTGSTYNSLIVLHYYNHINTAFEYFEYIDIQAVIKDDESAMIVAESFATRDVNVIEDMFTNEILQNPVCDASKEKKFSLCKLLADRELYSSFFWTVDKEQFENENDIPCEQNTIYLMDLHHFNDEGMVNFMFPCYGRSTKREDKIVEEYNRAYHISAGPRKNSAIVYKYTNELCIVYEFIENIDWNAL